MRDARCSTMSVWLLAAGAAVAVGGCGRCNRRGVLSGDKYLDRFSTAGWLCAVLKGDQAVHRNQGQR